MRHIVSRVCLDASNESPSVQRPTAGIVTMMAFDRARQGKHRRISTPSFAGQLVAQSNLCKTSEREHFDVVLFSRDSVSSAREKQLVNAMT